MGHWIDTLDKAEKVQKREEKRELSFREKQQERLREVEDEILADSFTVVGAAINFCELDPENIDEIPPEWIEKYGEKTARERHRVAKSAWLSAKNAPVGIKAAMQTSLGIVKARATEKASPKSLSMTLVKMTAMHEYPSQEIEE